MGKENVSDFRRGGWCLLMAKHLRLILHQDPVIVGQGDRIDDSGNIFKAIMPLASLGAGAPNVVDAVESLSNLKYRLRNPCSFHSAVEHISPGGKVIRTRHSLKVLKKPKEGRGERGRKHRKTKKKRRHSPGCRVIKLELGPPLIHLTNLGSIP